MGCWNGVGGKLEKNETPRNSIIRELAEETGIEKYELKFRGIMTWTVDNVFIGGMYVYTATVDDTYVYKTPLITEEGILDWKDIEWIKHPENLGIVENVSLMLDKTLHEESCYRHHVTYIKDDLVDFQSIKINAELENMIFQKDDCVENILCDFAI